jgi:hypothetical protein
VAASDAPRALLGVDFDNTLVSYDRLFAEAAAEQGLLPGPAAHTKEEVRNRLRQAGRENDWTWLQGWAYGPGMARAKPFPGALEFLRACARSGITVEIISHRTRTPYMGEPHDLHAAARAWLELHAVTAEGGLPADRVHFETTREAKFARIAASGCSHFIDDLPEFLSDPSFPPGVDPIVFDPHRSSAAAATGFRRIGSWEEASCLLELLSP